MERRETFILTLFCDSQPPLELRGRLRHVVTNREGHFTDPDDLIRLLRLFVSQERGGEEDYEHQIRDERMAC